MHRSTWCKIWLVLAVVVAPLVASLPFASVDAFAGTAPAAPNANPDVEIILLESNGRIRVDDPYVAPGVQQVVWNSGADIGWSAVAAGDFNGDGDAEIVAIRGGTLKVFDPVTPAGMTPVSFEYTLPAGRTFRLVVTGDFDNDGRAEIAAAHTDSIAGTGVVESVKIFDAGATGTNWTVVRSEPFGAPWIEMATGDVNNDGHDDLVMIRQAQNLVKVYSGANWSTLAEQSFTFGWIALAVGNISATYPGAEIALTRGEVLGQLDSVILLRLVGSTLQDLPPDLVVNRKFFPYFQSITTGNLNGDLDDEVLLLRDPTEPRVSLLSLNPNGVPMREFEQAIGYGSTAWKLVRAGDIDADGRDEVVVLRGDRYRIYREPELADTFTETLGSFLVSAVPSNTSTMVLADVDGAGQFLGPALGVAPLSLTFNLEYSQPSPTETIKISNVGTGSAFAWQAQVTAGSAWLKIDKISGTTPADLIVSVDTGAVGPGTYTGTIRISATTAGVLNTPRDVTVTLNLTGVGLRVTPTLLSLTAEYGKPSPEQTITVRSAGGSGAISWQADILEGQAWLYLSALQGVSPSDVSVSVNATAAGPGAHSGTIRIRAVDPQVADSPQFVTVQLTVPDPGFVVMPSEITIMQKFSAPTVVRNVSIWRPGGSVNWVAIAVSTQSAAAVVERVAAGEDLLTAASLAVGDGAEQLEWLVFTPTAGTTNPTTPTTMSVSIKPGTPVGKYAARIIVNASGDNVPNPVQYVDVTGVVANEVYRTVVPMLVK